MFAKKFILALIIAIPLFADKILIPMDVTQTDHLKAYGIAYHTLEMGINVEWLLNFRNGSFLMDYDPNIEKNCAINGVLWEVVPAGRVLEIYQIIQENNMETILLEKAPRIAVYNPTILNHGMMQ